MISLKKIRETISEWIRPKEESPELNKTIKFEKSFKEDVFTSKEVDISKNNTHIIYLSRVFNEKLRVFEYFFLDEKRTLIRHAQDSDGDLQHQVTYFYFNVLGDNFLKNNSVYIKLVKY